MQVYAVGEPIKLQGIIRCAGRNRTVLQADVNPSGKSRKKSFCCKTGVGARLESLVDMANGCHGQ